MTLSLHCAFLCCPPVPQIGDMRDKPIIGYVGDYVVFACKMDENKPKPDSWNWSKKNGTEKVKELLPDTLTGSQICCTSVIILNSVSF